jgi:hypothetical protein
MAGEGWSLALAKHVEGCRWQRKKKWRSAKEEVVTSAGLKETTCWER